MRKNRLNCALIVLTACRQSTPEASNTGVQVQAPGTTVQVQGAPSNDPSVATPQPAQGVVVQNTDPNNPQVQVQGSRGGVNVGVQRDPTTGAQTINVGGLQINVPGGGAAVPAVPTPNAQPGTHAPIVCSGSDAVVLDGTTIVNPVGPAVDASGSCTVTLTNCMLNGTVGINASGSAVVTLHGGAVTGTASSIMSTGSARVVTTGTTTTGPTHHSGSSTILQS
jgi:hypothetical protein